MILRYRLLAFLSLAAIAVAAAASHAATAATQLLCGEKKYNAARHGATDIPDGTAVTVGNHLLQVASTLGKKIKVVDPAEAVEDAQRVALAVAATPPEAGAGATAGAGGPAAAVALSNATGTLWNTVVSAFEQLMRLIPPRKNHSAAKDPGNVDCAGGTPEAAAVVGCRRPLHHLLALKLLQEGVAVVSVGWLLVIVVIALAAGLGLLYFERIMQRPNHGRASHSWGTYGPQAHHGNYDHHGYDHQAGYGGKPHHGYEPWSHDNRYDPSAHHYRAARLDRNWACC